MDRKKLSDLKRDSNYKAEIILWLARKITVIMCAQKFSIHHKISHYQDKRYFTTKMNVDFIYLMNHCDPRVVKTQWSFIQINAK